MASFFLPSSWQKRLLRYALSRLELVDTDALDLDKLDIAWGRQSTVNLRDVGIRIEKLSSLLGLPQNVDVKEARILSLKITVPANVYQSPIVVEVEGVNAHCRLVYGDSSTPSTGRRRRKKGKAEGLKHKAETGPSEETHESDDEEREGSMDYIPTTTDLAASFLEHENLPEKAQVEAELANYAAKSTNLAQSTVSSTSGGEEEDDGPLGTGLPFTLPDFLADFLKGIGDRLQVHITDVALVLETDLPSDAPGTGSEDSSKGSETVSLHFKIRSARVDGLRSISTSPDTADQAGSANEASLAQYDSERPIAIREISAWIVSHPTVFESSRSGQASPAATLASLSRESTSRSLRESSQPRSKRTLQQSGSDGPSISHSQGSETQSPSRQQESISSESRLEESLFRPTDPSPRPSARNPGREDEEASGDLEIPTLGRAPQSTTSDPSTLQVEDAPTNYFGLDDVDQLGGTGSSTPHGEDDLSESKLFSHEEAQSMYMSAMTAASNTGERQKTSESKLPGHSGDDDEAQMGAMLRHEDKPAGPRRFSSDLEPTDLPFATQEGSGVHPVPASSSLRTQDATDPSEPSKDLSYPEDDVPKSSDATVPFPSDGPSDERQASPSPLPHLAKEILNIDQLDLWLLSNSQSSTIIPQDASVLGANTQPGTSTSSSRLDMPGAFSAYASQHKPSGTASSLRFETPRNRPDQGFRPSQNKPQSPKLAIRAQIDTITAQSDLSLALLVSKVWQQISELLQSSSSKAESEPDPEKSGSGLEYLQLSVGHSYLRFVERVRAVECSLGHQAETRLNSFDGLQAEDDVLLQAHAESFRIAFKSISDGKSSTEMSLSRFAFGYPGSDILSFDRGQIGRASARRASQVSNPDLTIKIETVSSVNRIRADTLPVKVSLDLQKLDETFGWLGGFSSILGLGSSIMSNTTLTGRKVGFKEPSSPKRSRTVRFESAEQQENLLEGSLSFGTKIDVRVGGLGLDLVGKECLVRLRSSALKLVARDAALAMQVEKVTLSGPHLKQSRAATSMSAEVGNMRCVYLSRPEETDLGHLLSLITPSNAKFDEDDDILVDTLIRQRRQGPVFRINAASLGAGIDSLDDVRYLNTLGDEITKLSTVAKYFPESDRPGIMTLLSIQESQIELQLASRLGHLSVKAVDCQAAHITMPSLGAIGVKSVRLVRNREQTLIESAVTSYSPNTPYMILARIIGDEMEPTLRLKFCGLQAYYNTSTIFEILGLSDETTANEVVADLADSIATLTEHTTKRSSSLDETSSPASSTSHSRPLSPFGIDVHLRDCVLALDPRAKPSRALLVLTDARARTPAPKRKNTRANVNINKGFVLVVDDIATLVHKPANESKAAGSSFDYASAQVVTLNSMGYVSVGYVSSAKLALQMLDKGNTGGQMIDCQLEDNLIVLEACADSMQTLIDTIDGLKLPTPPSKDLKYRTEVVPIRDMLASLTGEAFETLNADKKSKEAGTLENIDEENLTHEASGSLILDPDMFASTDDDNNFDAYVSEHEDFQDASAEEEENDNGSVSIREVGDQVLLESFQPSQPDENLQSEPLDFVDEYFRASTPGAEAAHKWDSTQHTTGMMEREKVSESPFRLRVRNVHVIWNLFDGYDWQSTRDTIDKAVRDIEGRALEQRSGFSKRAQAGAVEEDESVIGDFLFNSIYIGIPANRDPRDLAQQINQQVDDLASETASQATSNVTPSPSRQSQPLRSRGKRLRLHRSKHHKITFELKGVSADVVMYPPGSGETQSSIDVRVHDIEIFDHVPSSTWKKFATYMLDYGEREAGADMVHIKAMSVRPIPELAASELVVRVNVLPLRLHVDQDALDFMTRFFEFKNESKSSQGVPAAGDAVFLQRIEIDRIPVKLDYKPKMVDYAGLRSGHTTEFMNFFVLDQADFNLEHVIVHGVSGFDKLSKTLNDTWMPDIRRNQLPRVLSGIAPVRSLVNVGGGVRDLVVVPMREYRKDGRLVRSIQKGALAFAKTTTSELAKLGTKLAIGTQSALQGAEGLLNPAQPVVRTVTTDTAGEAWEDADLDEEEKKAISLYADQPIGVLQGLRGAYSSLQRDLLTARDAIVAVPGEVIESGTAQGAAKAVARRAPTVIFRPAIGASKAISQTLMGANNALDPQHWRRMDEKYKKH